jgi:prepilin-type N-terminal cleavage/methylation domain-containing protein
MDSSNVPSARRFDARLRLRARRLRARLGYTVIEVMMALAVLSIGATGVIALQKAALLGNVRARDLATATTLASTWIERLRVDALRWSVGQNGLSTIGTTTWLQVVQDDFPTISAPGEGQWIAPAATFNYQAGADVHGFDATPASGQQSFCVNLRLTQVLPSLIRAEVRVYWLRTHNQAQQQDQYGSGILPACSSLCDSSPSCLQALDTNVALSRYHFVYMTSAISRNDS